MVRQRIYSKKDADVIRRRLISGSKISAFLNACHIWQLFEEVFQIPFGVQVVGFGCFNQAVDDGTEAVDGLAHVRITTGNEDMFR